LGGVINSLKKEIPHESYLGPACVSLNNSPPRRRSGLTEEEGWGLTAAFTKKPLPSGKNLRTLGHEKGSRQVRTSKKTFAPGTGKRRKSGRCQRGVVVGKTCIQERVDAGTFLTLGV